MKDLLEYALLYLEDELAVCDNKYLELDIDLSEHPQAELIRDWVVVDNPRFKEGVHDSPHYRAQISHDLNRVRELLGR
ncbi:hypothetical protein [Streptococcus danieliae]|uniref:hypothetical protein n=1 Tax=Streptococcus danieliae TaxID=747656 RepID=UPI0021C6C9DB|nr:hypothetical protein [Streptococcus danieliae]MCU0082624.1 hypothetical protein [Streptococcus danieliae]